MLARGRRQPGPAARQRFLAAIEEVIAAAERLVDIAAIEPFGYVVESATLPHEALASYWEPLWTLSSRVAVTVCG